MFLIALLSFISVVLLAITIYMNKNKNYWKKRHIPEVHGITWRFLRDSKSLSEIYKDVYDGHPTEDNVGLFLGSKPALILRNLENIQAVFLGDFRSFNSRGIGTNSNDLLADNVLFMEEYKRWRLVRQKLSPVFTSKKLKNMFYIMNRCAEDFIKFIEHSEEARDRPFNVLYTYMTSSIGAAVFGIDTNTKNTMDSPFSEMARKSQEPTLINKLKFILPHAFPTVFKLLNIKLFGEHEEFFIDVVKKALKSRRSGGEKRHDFIDTCIELQKEGLMKDLVTGYELEPSDELMAAQAFFFFIAGADVSAYTMHFVLLELAGNPNILLRLHNEIDNVFEKSFDKISFDDIENMKYLDMVMNEAIRKYPTVGAIQRRCTKETTLPIGQVKIEKDVTVVIPVYAIHRDERYYPNSELFDPERFSTENISKISKFSYLPFGEGNRSCLGARFARLQVKVGLLWLLRYYTLKERVYKSKYFEPSSFAIRDTNARFDLIPRRKV